MKQLRRIDQQGFYLEDLLADEDYQANSQEIAAPIPQEAGLWYPRWNGQQWVEGLSTSEIVARIPAVTVDLKATLLAKLNSATTVNQLKSALISYYGDTQ